MTGLQKLTGAVEAAGKVRAGGTGTGSTAG